MGMFDRIIFSCPNCECGMETQTKSGECQLKKYYGKCVPADAACGAVGRILICEACGVRYEVDDFKMPRVVLSLKEITDDILD